MSQSVREKSTMRLVYLLTIYPIWKFVEAIMNNNAGYIMIYGFLLVMYIAMLIYLTKSRILMKKRYKGKTADSLYEELKKKEDANPSNP